ncbi:metallo-beta-lactamase, partial [Aphelenchoides avenae]
VDTGLGLLRNTVTGGLAAHGVKTADITDVLLTHTDVDTAGNLNLFPGARVFSGQRRFKLQYMYNDTKPPTFDTRRSGLPFTKLCDNTEVFLTPGYSAHDVSLVVNNVHSYGTFAIVGRLIADERDLETGMSMKEFSIDKEHRRLWEIARNEVLCLSDYVIP